ncbi:O-methyltransferase [Gracilibacillus timonensis]|uniref:O-methyltransferase n=1 Tax=Gracilibacillus timonensis TaxID=1816696 RepID=UPI00082673E8|nr:O-methyltransferase [Gracilibacillus timonensis]
MNESQLIHYLDSLPKQEPAWVKQMQHDAQKDHVPIMDIQGIALLQQLIRLYQPQKLLEIGTAIGYSALRMIEAKNNLEIVTIERDQAMYQRAMDHIVDQGRQAQIEVILGDALELAVETKTKGKFDMIFIDAAKGQYRRFFELYEGTLSKNGVIITDNVLFHGYVANPDGAPKRLRNMVKKIDAYNRWLLQHQGYDTVILPIGDGIAISIKRENDYIS